MKLVTNSQHPSHLISLVGNDFLRFDLSKNLTDHSGYLFNSFPTLLEFLQNLEKERPELVIINTHLPDRSGLELIDELTHQGLSIPLIYITKNSPDQYVTYSQQYDFIRFLKHPFDIKQLIELIEEIVTKKQEFPNDIAPFNSTDYLQMAEYGRYSVKIEVFKKNKQIGEIIVSEGLPWNAKMKDKSPLTAFQELVSCEADYVTCHKVNAQHLGKQTLFGTAEHLLLETFQQIDEGNKDREHFFSSLELERVPHDMFEFSSSSDYYTTSDVQDLQDDIASIETSTVLDSSLKQTHSQISYDHSLSQSSHLSKESSYDELDEVNDIDNHFLSSNADHEDFLSTPTKERTFTLHPTSESTEKNEYPPPKEKERTFTLHPTSESTEKNEYPPPKKKKRTFTLHPVSNDPDDINNDDEEKNPWDTSDLKDSQLSDFERLFEDGLDALLSKDYATALKIFNQANLLKPDDGRVQANLKRLKSLGYS